MAPAAGQAATTIGQLGSDGELADAPDAPCTAGLVYTHTETAGVGYDLANSPTVITSWATTMRPQITTNRQGALKVLANNGDGTFTVLATSAVETLVKNSGASVNRFSVRIPTPGGGQLAYAPADPTGTTPAQKCRFEPAGGGAGNTVRNGPSSGAVGTSFTPNSAGGVGFRLSIEATFEPDADVDGFGDESQDRCPGIAGADNGCAAAVLPPPPPPDRTKPTLGGLSFARSTFAAAKSGAAFSAQKGKKKKKSTTPVGTKVSFNLSEAASVKFTVQRETSDRRSKGKCRTRTRANRKKPKCKLWKNVTGSFTYNGKAGKNTFTFRGRIGGNSLRTGSYRLNGTATDPSRNASIPKNKAFRIVR